MPRTTAQTPLAGSIFIVAAPSGAGKTSLVKALLEAEPALYASVSHTTRAPRPGERDGCDYHFVDVETFRTMAAEGAFLEHAEVFGNFYGTAREVVLARLARGEDVILEIDWQGARQVRAALPEAVGIFVLPPARAVLEQRLRTRGQDDEQTILRRLAEAREELTHYKEFDYLVVNDRFELAVAQLRAIVTARRLRQEAQTQRLGGLLADLLA